MQASTDWSGNADEDDPAQRGCSRLKKTVGLTSTTFLVFLILSIMPRPNRQSTFKHFQIFSRSVVVFERLRIEAG